jgi:ureidoacrylate peracid hydrolase
MTGLFAVGKPATLLRLAGTLLAASLAFAATEGSAQSLPPLARDSNPSETALLLVDFQYPFTNPAGANHRAVKKELEEKQLLERTVDLVKKARSLGVWVVHVTEGYSSDYRELDAANPGGFHRGQILRQAWKIGTEAQSYYPPLLPGPGDKDLTLPPRIQTSAFGGTGLDQILRSRGIRNIAVAGFTTDVCVYALKDAMVGYFPDQAELMLKNTYPMWSKVVSNDEWLAMLNAGAKVSTR